MNFIHDLCPIRGGEREEIDKGASGMRRAERHLLQLLKSPPEGEAPRR